MTKYADLEALIRDFARNFRKGKPTNLNDKTIAHFFASELARQIRQYATVRKRVEEGDEEGDMEEDLTL